MNELLAHYNHLKQTDPNYVATVLASRQLRDLLETRRNAFWWRVGRYDVTFEVSSPSKTLLTPFRRYFELTAMDVENQQRNIDLIDTDVRNRIQYDVPGFQAAPVEWNWTQAALRKS